METRSLGPHSFMLIRHGHVIAEGWWDPYRQEDVHLLYSLSKSFTSTAVGFARAEGLLTLQDKVVSFFPDDLPSQVSENLAAMTIRDLLTMNTGHEIEPQRGSLTGEPYENWVAGFLAHPVSLKPGTKFLYNSAATYMCSAILHKLTDLSLLEYLLPRLLNPLGVEKAHWETCPRGIQVGGWGLSVTTETIAKFGQLYLQKGKWEGSQLLPEGWVEEASAAQVSNADGQEPHDWNQGYGYQFWRSRHNCYRGDGAFGQNAVVMKDYDAVLVTTASNPDLGATHQLVWDHLLPAMAAASEGPIKLARKLEELEIGVEGIETIPESFHGTFSGESMELRVDADGLRLQWESLGQRQCLVAPTDKWLESRANIDGKQIQRVAARAAFQEGTGLVLRGLALETPFQITVLANPEGDGKRLEWIRFGDFGPSEGPSEFLQRR